MVHKATGQNRTTDDDEDNIRYYIDWGDGSSKWYGPYASGETFSVQHKWTIKSSIIKVKARDAVGDESEWTTIQISMPRNLHNNQFINIINRLIGKYLLNHPIFSLIYNIIT